MHWLGLLPGRIQIELSSASPEDTLSFLNKQGIVLTDIKYNGDLSVIGTVFRRDYEVLRAIAKRRGDMIKIIGKTGAYWALSRFIKRPALLLVSVFLLGASFFLQNRILFVEVEGNESVPVNLILEKAEACGIGFGAVRRDVRSESIKNYLLSEIPQLQWVGVNTSGCTAVVSVQEREEAGGEDLQKGISSIVATKDGVIQSCTVQRGSALCKTGQVVKAGQVLVSGYTDCGLCIRVTGADAEIIAQTAYDIKAVTPQIIQTRGQIRESKKKYSLIIGKKLIKLSQDSGISDSTCVKMYNSYFITLPGRFQLPVGVRCEQYIVSDFQSAVSSQEHELDWLQKYAEEYLESQMFSGKILNCGYSAERQAGIFVLSGHFSCSEMIGQVKYEEIAEDNGENN